MKIRKEDNKLKIVLSPECTIANTEADTNKIRELFSEKPEKIELNAEAVEELDTAYFQMLLSLKTMAEHHEIPFFISGISSETERVCELYGIKLETSGFQIIKGNNTPMP